MFKKGSTKYTKELLEDVVSKSKSYAEVFRNMGLDVVNNTKSRYIRNLIRYFEISVEHFLSHPTRDKTAENCEGVKKSREINRWSNEKVFCQNSIPMGGSKIKKRLFELGWKEVCAECGLGSEWLGKPLVLHLDHINGISNDNRFENLRLLCPNCHSQTETYSNKRGKLPDNLCIDCGKVITKGYKRCTDCALKYRYGDENKQKELNKRTKIAWPADEELWKMVEEKPFTIVSKELGVSDNAIRKRLKVRFGEYPKHRWGFRK